MYTPKEAAKQLGVSTATVLRRIKDGSLKAYKMSRTTIRISEDDLQAYRRACETQSQ